MNLGVMNYNGKGTRKDVVLAYMWWHLAQLGGDTDTVLQVRLCCCCCCCHSR